MLECTVSAAPGGMPEKAQPLRPPQPIRRPCACSQVGESIRRERATDPSPTEEAGGNSQYPSFVVSCEAMSDFLRPQGQSPTRLSSTISQSLLKFTSIESLTPSNHLILCCPLLLHQSIPASGSFPIGRLFASGGQGTGASTSTSVLPMNIQFVMGLENKIPCTRSGRASQSISPVRSLHLREMT